MNITVKNFSEKLPELRETIEKASFFAIDTEFTGLCSGNSISAFDTPEDLYLKTNEATNGFVIIQLGLTAFSIEDENSTKFKYKSYNIFAYPRARQQIFKCQGDSLAFLASAGFDFNKLFLEGVSYCDKIEAEALKKRMEERQSNRAQEQQSDKVNTSHHIPVPDEVKPLIEKVSQQIDDFLKSNESELIIDNSNNFYRKLIYQLIEAKYFDKVSASAKTLENNHKVILVSHKRSPEEEKLFELEKIKKEQEEIDNAIGLSSVMQLISESKKLIIGHNMLLDLMYIMRQFFGPLPHNYEEFKSFLHRTFPYILDTKYLCRKDELKLKINSSVLQHLVNTIKEEPFKLPDLKPEKEEYGYSLENAIEHEAGYDSYITGLSFIALAQYLNVKFNELPNCNKLKNFTNRIFIMKLQDYYCINLTGKEPKVSRDHVFHITFPCTWKQADIVYHFRNFGQIYVSWLSDTSAFVSLNCKENALILLKTIGYTADVKIKKYDDFKKELLAKHENNKFDTAKKRKRAVSETSSIEDDKKKLIKTAEVTRKLVTPNIIKYKKTFKHNDDW